MRLLLGAHTSVADEDDDEEQQNAGDAENDPEPHQATTRARIHNVLTAICASAELVGLQVVRCADVAAAVPGFVFGDPQVVDALPEL